MLIKGKLITVSENAPSSAEAVLLLMDFVSICGAKFTLS